MTSLIFAWLIFPLAAAFLAALLNNLGRLLATLTPLLTLVLASWLSLNSSALPLTLMSSPGVALNLTTSQLGFLILNGLVSTAVALQVGSKPRHKLSWVLMLILHGALNSVYVAADLMSIYVAIELVAVSAFLLIIDVERRETLWIAFRYLILGDLAMILYDFGALIAYQANGDFALESQTELSSVATSLLVVGLLFKTGAFLTGFWLPMTHANAPTEVSALLSSLVVTAGAAPLSRISEQSGEAAILLAVFGSISLALGVIGAMVQTDIKRLLAWSTISQMGYVLLTPATASLYALAHGVGKAALFLQTGQLQSREIKTLQQSWINLRLGIPLLVATFSLIGVPGSIGYTAKSCLTGVIDSDFKTIISWSGLGTAIVFARLLPDRWYQPSNSIYSAKKDIDDLIQWPKIINNAGTWLLIIGILSLPIFIGRETDLRWPNWDLESVLMSLLIVSMGITIERFIRRPLSQWQPPNLERFVDVIAALGITLLLSQVVLWQITLQ